MRQKWEGDCGLWILNEIILKIYAESLKKNVGAVGELPANLHSQSSQTWVEMGWIGCAI
jgi:hypothetical protein